MSASGQDQTSAIHYDVGRQRKGQRLALACRKARLQLWTQETSGRCNRRDPRERDSNHKSDSFGFGHKGTSGLLTLIGYAESVTGSKGVPPRSLYCANPPLRPKRELVTQ